MNPDYHISCHTRYCCHLQMVLSHSKLSNVSHQDTRCVSEARSGKANAARARAMQETSVATSR